MNRIDVINNIEIRSIGGNKLEVKGLLPINKFSETLFNAKKRAFFREIIRAGAFEQAVENNTPKLWINHKADFELKAEFTRLEETRRGLEFTAIVKDGDELKNKLQQVKGLSFGFVAGNQEWTAIKGDYIREIYSFDRLIEISILVGLEPCYSSTEVIIVPEGVEAKLDELQRYKLFIREQQLKILKQQLEELKGE